MYNGVTEAFQSKIAEHSRTFQARLIDTAHSEEVISDGFFSVKSYGQSNEDNETLSLGGTVSTYIEVELYKPAYMVTGKEYEYQIGLLLDDGTLEYVPVGKFTAQKPSEDDGKVTFTAYDRFVSRLSGLFTSELSYPVDGKEILNEIQTKSGVQIANISSLPDGVMIPKRASTSEEDEDGNTTTTYVNPFDGFSYRESIGYLALMYGKFATVNRDGNVELRWYTDSGYRVEDNMSYNDITCAETDFEVQYVECTIGDDSENVLTSGSGATGISANAPVMTQALLDGIYAKVGGLNYTPTTLSFKGDPRLDLGDIITVVKRDGTEVKVPLMTLNFDYDGGLTDEVGSYGDTEQSSEANDAGPTTKRMDRVYSDLLLVKEVVASKASIAYLQANYANITELDAATARIDTLESTQITTSYLQVNYATIDLANISAGSITNAMLGTAVVDTANLKDASISDGKIVSLTATKLTAGTIDASYINVVNLNCANLTVGTINGTQIASSTIAYSNLSSSAVTSITDTISIGGTQLLLGTKTQDTSKGNKKEGATATSDTLNGCTVFKTAYAWNDIGFYFNIQIIPKNIVKVGDILTYSIWMKTDDTVIRNIYGLLQGYSGSYYFNKSVGSTATEWTQCSFTFTVTEEMLNMSGNYAWQTRFECTTSCTSGTYIYWACPKLERGNKATDWTPAPEDVDTAITAVQTTADGKNTAYYQTVAPTGGTYNTNDLWFDTDNGNKMYYYSGDRWVETQFGTAAIVVGAITADKIAASAVTTGAIATGAITAVKIATGTITATQIATGTITGDLISAGTIGTTNLGASCITSDKIVSGAITTDKLAASAVTADKINVTDLFAQDIIATGTITGLNLFSAYIESTSGLIGGFNIGSTCLYKGSDIVGTSGGAYFGNDGFSISDLFSIDSTGKVSIYDSGKDIKFEVNQYGVYVSDIDNATETRYSHVSPYVIGSSAYSNTSGDSSWTVMTTLLGNASLTLGGDSVNIDLVGNSDNLITFGLTLSNPGTIGMSTSGTLEIVSNTIELTGNTISSGHLWVGGYNHSNYALSTSNFICQSWVRTVGATGWYNETYGGGWYMTDSNYIRNYGSKSPYINTDIYIEHGKYLRDPAYGVIAACYTGSGLGVAIRLGGSDFPTTIMTSNNVWKNGSTTTYFATTSTSDRRLKDYVSDMNAYEDIFMDLKPVAFKYHDGLYNAPGKVPLVQWGFYAQDTVQAFEKHGIDWNEQELVVVEDGELSAEEQKYVSSDMLKMNYQNLIALDTHMIQTTILRVDDQEQRIRDLQNQLYSLQFAFEQQKLEIAQLKQAVA